MNERKNDDKMIAMMEMMNEFFKFSDVRVAGSPSFANVSHLALINAKKSKNEGQKGTLKTAAAPICLEFRVL